MIKSIQTTFDSTGNSCVFLVNCVCAPASYFMCANWCECELYVSLSTFHYSYSLAFVSFLFFAFVATSPFFSNVKIILIKKNSNVIRLPSGNQRIKIKWKKTWKNTRTTQNMKSVQKKTFKKILYFLCRQLANIYLKLVRNAFRWWLLLHSYAAANRYRSNRNRYFCFVSLKLMRLSSF